MLCWLAGQRSRRGHGGDAVDRQMRGAAAARLEAAAAGVVLHNTCKYSSGDVTLTHSNAGPCSQRRNWVQVHDEVILEGPKESADRAQELVVGCMMNPFDGRNPLDVELVVDAKHADTWFAAK